MYFMGNAIITHGSNNLSDTSSEGLSKTLLYENELISPTPSIPMTITTISSWRDITGDIEYPMLLIEFDYQINYTGNITNNTYYGIEVVCMSGYNTSQTTYSFFQRYPGRLNSPASFERITTIPAFLIYGENYGIPFRAANIPSFASIFTESSGFTFQFRRDMMTSLQIPHFNTRIYGVS